MADSSGCKLLLVRLLRVPFDFSQRLVAGNRRDLVGRASGFRQAARRSFAQAMRGQPGPYPGLGRTVTKPVVEGRARRKRLTGLGDQEGGLTAFMGRNRRL
nr:hypothetical protein [Gluconacetobacter diazotrophicus]